MTTENHGTSPVGRTEGAHTALQTRPSPQPAIEEVAESTTARGFWTRSHRAGTLFAVLGIAAAVGFGALAPSDQDARFRLSESADGFTIPIPAAAGAIAFGVLCAVAGVLLFTGVTRRFFGWSVGVALTSLLLSFLCWQVAGETMAVVTVAQTTLLLSLPLILGSLSGVLCERAGVINIAIEGQFLAGACAGALVGTLASNLWVGLAASALAGLFIAWLLAIFAIRYLVDQVVLGVVLNVFALGLTGFLFSRLMQPEQQTYNNPGTFKEVSIPLLSDIPFLGPVLFEASMFLYIALALVVIIQIGLFHTRWGLRVRAVGEHPTAADTVGIRVNRVRYLNVLYGGLVAGIGGAFFTLGRVGPFQENMTDGKGFIALAALIFGRWSPTGALAAALLFGFAEQLQIYLSAIGSEIPSEILAMAPYLATLLAVAGLIGKVRAPAADGQPYVNR
mgnify:CR=1 FL=1